jgi:hypothetical protein
MNNNKISDHVLSTKDDFLIQNIRQSSFIEQNLNVAFMSVTCLKKSPVFKTIFPNLIPERLKNGAKIWKS